jgi:hypothetical protein
MINFCTEQIALKDINLLDVGNTIQIAGLIMSNGHTDYYCYLPEEKICPDQKILSMDLSEWEKFIQQTDVCETEILAKDKTGKLVKVLMRKANRQIDAGVTWKVFDRDGYACRYCGIKAVPMTVDHVILWEDSGPSTVSNLVTSCRKCNKLRGNTKYEDWLKCDDYKKRSSALSENVKKQNLDLLGVLDSIPRK